MTDVKAVTIVYDGECPFCTKYVKMLRLRAAFGEVKLIDARSDCPEAAQARDLFDLDDGMAAHIGDRWYHGADCINALSLASSPSSLVNKMMAQILSDPKRANFLYPYLRGGRNAVLKLLGRKPLGNPSMPIDRL